MAGTDWLANLEAKVRAAAERIDTLRRQNQALSRRVQELESELAARQEPATAALAAAGETAARAEAAGGWLEERRQIRLQVERLTARLEELMVAAAGTGSSGED